MTLYMAAATLVHYYQDRPTCKYVELKVSLYTIIIGGICTLASKAMDGFTWMQVRRNGVAEFSYIQLQLTILIDL